MYLKLLNAFSVRYHWCYAPRYRLEVICLHKFGATQLLYGSVTLARCAALPFCKTLTTTSRDFLSILTVDFPALLRNSVHLTFGSIHMVRLRRVTLCPLRLPYLLPHCGFPCSASQLGKSYVRKKAMQWICRRFTPPSSTALLFPMPSYMDTYIDTTSTTLARDDSSRVS